MKRIITIILFYFLIFTCYASDKDKLNIAGEWTVELDSTDVGLENGLHNKAFHKKINLPGTTDDAGIGIPNTLTPALTRPQLSHLTRKNSYIGSAWYTREISIPKNWNGKDLVLKLERVIWESQLWIDGKEVSKGQNSLIAPHYYNLTDYVKAGKKHRLTIKIDNRKKFDISVNNLGHAYTNDTQIIWNGIIGEMQIEALEPVRVTNIQVTPDIASQRVKVKLSLLNNTSKVAKTGLSIGAKHKNSGLQIPVSKQSIKIEPGESSIETEYKMGSDIKLWSEFSPDIYELTATLAINKSSSSVDFGMRKFSANGSVLTINDRPVFLRGTLECNIFPLKGHPPMDKKGWMKVFETAKLWGMNHLRFHSWCPPKVAFEVADEIGFYLQVELPVWATNIGEDEPTITFLYDEAQRIMNEYGNHPSFCMWSLGNELQGDMGRLDEIVKFLKSKDSRHLYTATSFTFESGHGVWPEKEDDFLITQWTAKGWVRGQGVFNSESPTFDKDYAVGVEGMTVPLITHEIGQYAVYPKLDEIAKYTGVLEPLNFISVKEDLRKKGMLHKAADYTEASGKLAVILYKEEIERALKTAGISGFQLLDLHDFPGQGTALVGLLDAFWDSKNLISDEDFRQFSSPIVPLLRFPKATYGNDESFVASLDISNYWEKALPNQKIEWIISNDNIILDSGSVDANVEVGYNHGVANIAANLGKVSQATKLNVKVRLKGTQFQNQWNIWVYPQHQTIDYGDIEYTRDLQEAYELLEEGKKVLLNPVWQNTTGIEGKFVPVFWSPVHFPKQAGTMGVLCSPDHAALADFPTDKHTDWQWWDLNINSTTLIIDSIEGGTPIVEMVDNFTNNRKLASLFEGSVGSGKLMVASFDLTTDIETRLVAKQMLISILNYMKSESFNPRPINNPTILNTVLKRKETEEKESATSVY